MVLTQDGIDQRHHRHKYEQVDLEGADWYDSPQ